jgi:putative ABC transport system permease protein
MAFILSMIKLGLSNLWVHKMRSALTALGIIFGVAAVIIMVSIGEGSAQQALARIERLGAKNIIIRSQRPPESTQMGGGRQQGRSSRYGLTWTDFQVLKDNLPGAESVVPLKEVGGQVLKENRRQTSQSFGVTPELLQIANLRVSRGRYISAGDLDDKAMVCVIGAEVARTMFPFEDPLQSTIRIDDKTLQIIGVLAPVGLAGGAAGALVGRDYNLDVHVPMSTAQMVFGDRVFRRTSGNFSAAEVQVSEMYVAAPSRDDVIQYADLIRRILEVRKPGMPDVSLIVPYELLESAKRDALTWQLVLSCVAGISLLVGGIGIMNIMLASVTERTREIGIRRALGAKRKHIIAQFLIETGVLSVIGGVVGIGVGVGLSLALGGLGPWIAEQFRASVEISTRVVPWSIFVAFCVAAATGLIFGIYPAIQASRKDPIVALRHD